MIDKTYIKSENEFLMEKAFGLINRKTFKDDLIKIFPVNEGQPYIGSLCNHFRGKIVSGGIDYLIEEMDNYSLRKVITYYEKNKTNGN